MATDLNLQVAGIKDDYKYGFRDSDDHYAFKSGKGLSREVVNQISEMKNEPALDARIPAQGTGGLPARSRHRTGVADSRELNFDDIHYYMKAADRQGKTWDDVPAEIKNTFDKLGIPEAERKFLAGVGAQYESEVVYHSLREDLQKKGVIFVDTDTALREHPDLVKQYIGTIIPIQDNKFAALNSAVWSGGSFVYVPAGVKVDIPLQAYFRINAENMGQFERTLIIVEEGAQVHYVEGCTAPMYSTESLHSAVVEIIVKKGGAVPLHDHPELGQQHLQPRDQASGRPRGRPDGVGRRQSRQQADDEVPGRLHDGQGSARARSCRSPSPARDSTRTPAARSSTAPPTPVRGSSPRASARTAAGPATAACSRSPPVPRARSRTSSAMP